MSRLKFRSYIRKPFEVQAIEVTERNIEDLAELIGTVEQGDDGKPFILVDKEKVPNMTKILLGYWVTKVGRENIRCYTRKIFTSQFIENDDEIDEWVRFLNGKPARRMPLPSEEPVDLQ